VEIPPPLLESWSQIQLQDGGGAEGHAVCDLPCPGDGSQVCGGGGIGAGRTDENGVVGVFGLTVYRNLVPVGIVGVRGLENANATVVSGQGEGRRGSESRWWMACLVVWLGMVVFAL
jgi:hypothetical protein